MLNFRGNKDLHKLGKNISMLHYAYANKSFIPYSILKLLTYHTSFYH